AFVSLSQSRARDAGRAVGEIYACNILGTIVGALATPLVIIPRWGTINALAAAIGLYGAVAVILITGQSQRDHFRRIAVLAVAVMMLLVCKAKFDPRFTNAGMYMYGYAPPAQLRSRD